jgi:hypothetical protein
MWKAVWTGGTILLYWYKKINSDQYENLVHNQAAAIAVKKISLLDGKQPTSGNY